MINSHFIRNVLMVGGGIAAAQAIAILFMPILTRIYGPSAFGTAASINAIIGMAAPLATMGYAYAIVLPERDEKAAVIARLSFICASCLFFISLVMVVFLKDWLAEKLDLESESYVLYILPAALSVIGVLTVLDQSAIRLQLYKEKSRALFESAVATNMAKLFFGILMPTGFVFVVLVYFGKFINIILLACRMPRHSVWSEPARISFSDIGYAAKRYKDFAAYRVPQSVINAVSAGLPVILLTALFGSSFAGQYSLAVMSLGAPSMLIGQSVGEVFYPRITKEIRGKSHEAFRLLLKAKLMMLAVAVIPFGIIFIFGQQIFIYVFGAEWGRSGEYARWLSLMLLTTLILRASTAALPALGLLRFHFLMEMLLLPFRVGAFYIGYYYFNSDVYAVAMFCMVSMLFEVCVILYTSLYLGRLCERWKKNSC